VLVHDIGVRFVRAYGQEEQEQSHIYGHGLSIELIFYEDRLGSLEGRSRIWLS
jgi:hypothetical protein